MSDIYTWDFQNFSNMFPRGSTNEFMSTSIPEIPDWTNELMDRESRPLTREEIRDYNVPYGVKAFKIVDRLLPAGEAWTKAVHADLERRFPHEPDSTVGFHYYTAPQHGGLVIYDPGFDIHQEWHKIFGRTAPMFLNSRRLPDSYRPWLSNNGTPGVFFDGNREDYHQTDTLGAPYFRGAFVQTQIDWLYVFPFGTDASELRHKVMSTLGSKTVGWKCRIRP